MDATGTPRGASRPLQTLDRDGAEDVVADSLASMTLHTAAADEDVGAVAALLASGAAIVEVEEDGHTPLHPAAAAGAVDAAEASVFAGAAVDGPAGVAAHRVVALAARLQEVVHLLIQHVATVAKSWMFGKQRVGVLSLIFGEKRLVQRSEESDTLTNAERRAAWRAASAPSDAACCTNSSSNETFARLQAAHQRFLVTPSDLTPMELKSLLPHDLTLDAKCVWQAHQLLLLALRLGLFARGTPGLANRWQESLFGYVYMKALMQKQPYDGRLQKSIFNSARRHLSLDCDDASFPPKNWKGWSESQISGELTVVYLRLGLFQTALTGAGDVVCDTVKRLFGLPSYAADGGNPRVHETVVTSLTTIGFALAPVVVQALLLASGGSAMTAADRNAAAAAVNAFLADPADLASARQVLCHAIAWRSTIAIDAAPRRTAAQRAQVERIGVMLQPYKSLAALEAVLAWVVGRFGMAVAPPVSV